MTDKNLDLSVSKNMASLTLLVVLLFCLPTLAQSGGDYDLSWSTIDGGGGKSSGDSYTIFGTIGQPDAAYSGGGRYELLGGFWPGEPVCTVDFYHYARFAEWWLESDCGDENDFCGGADLPPQNGIVDGNDLLIFTDYWLDYCPLDWPLK